MSGRFEEEATASGKRAASRWTASTAPSTSGSRSRYAASMSCTTSVVDRLRRRVDSRRLVQVPRPLARAHAHHRALDLVVVAPAVLADIALADRVPDLLGLDQHAVHVEDDSVDHSGVVLAVPVYERARRRSLLGHEDRGDEERVVADVVLRDGARLDPAERTLDQRRDQPLARRDTLPVHDRRQARGELARDRLLPRPEHADGEAAGLPQELVAGRLLADRDPDERRLERQRDERGDGDAHPVAVVVDGRGPRRRAATAASARVGRLRRPPGR